MTAKVYMKQSYDISVDEIFWEKADFIAEPVVHYDDLRLPIELAWMNDEFLALPYGKKVTMKQIRKMIK